MGLLEDVFNAYYDARRNKRNTVNQLRFEIDLEENLIGLYREIAERRYEVGRSVCFMINRPVDREVFAADFRDRVVHHLLFNYINPVFDKTFIDDCYSCRKGRGTLYGVRRLERHIRSCSLNYTRNCYVLKLDLQGYFMNIDRKILYDEIMRTMRKAGGRKNAEGVCWKDTYPYEVAMYLLPLIVFNDPTKGCWRKGEWKGWDTLPHSKSLFYSKEGCGLPIGNLTSQLFSNIYLNCFDHFVKRELKIKHYGRYVDDFYLVHANDRYLLGLIPVMRDFLRERLGATLHPDKVMLVRYDQGLSFLGSYVKPFRRYLTPRCYGNFSSMLYRCRYCSWDSSTKERLLCLRSSVNSYLGLMRHSKSRKRIKRALSFYPYIFRVGYLKGPDLCFKIFESGRRAPPWGANRQD